MCRAAETVTPEILLVATRIWYSYLVHGIVIGEGVVPPEHFHVGNVSGLVGAVIISPKSVSLRSISATRLGQGSLRPRTVVVQRLELRAMRAEQAVCVRDCLELQ